MWEHFHLLSRIFLTFFYHQDHWRHHHCRHRDIFHWSYLQRPLFNKVFVQWFPICASQSCVKTINFPCNEFCKNCKNNEFLGDEGLCIGIGLCRLVALSGSEQFWACCVLHPGRDICGLVGELLTNILPTSLLFNKTWLVSIDKLLMKILIEKSLLETWKVEKSARGRRRRRRSGLKGWRREN